jgi:hypothetical protein
MASLPFFHAGSRADLFPPFGFTVPQARIRANALIFPRFFDRISTHFTNNDRP